MKRANPPTQREAEDLADTKLVGGRLPEDVPYAPVELEDGRWSVRIVSRMERKPLPDMVVERDGKVWRVVRKHADPREEVDPIALQTQQMSLPLQDKRKEEAT